MTLWVLGESLQQEMQEKSRGRLEVGTLPDRRAHTFHCLLLADFLGKAHLDKVQGELLDQKEMVQLGKEQALQVAVPELLRVGTAQGTAQGLRDRRGTAQGLLVQVDIVLVSQDQGGTRQVRKEVLGIAQALQDQSETGTGPEHLGQTFHQQSQWEQKAGWVLLALNRAIPGLLEAEGCWQGQKG